MPPGIYPRPSGNTIAERLEYYSMPEPNSGCHLWIGGGYHDFGYGQLNVRGKTCNAHVLAWIEKNGPVPAGRYVCHKCDVPECVNAKHMFLGSLKQNLDDMRAKRRHAFGERSGVAKLTCVAVRLIREDDRRHADIASDHGVTKGLISQVKRRKVWSHVT